MLSAIDCVLPYLTFSFFCAFEDEKKSNAKYGYLSILKINFHTDFLRSNTCINHYIILNFSPEICCGWFLHNLLLQIIIYIQPCKKLTPDQFLVFHSILGFILKLHGRLIAGFNQPAAAHKYIAFTVGS